ncbi:MAG: L-seryl-tRNA(Sec) selenium transferase [Pseudomonadales bacterium]
MSNESRLAKLPSVDSLLSNHRCQAMIREHGRMMTTDAIRAVLDRLRRNHATDGAGLPGETEIINRVNNELVDRAQPSLKPVINLTGTVLHTNLGRANLPAEAIVAMTTVAGTSNLEYELSSGERGDRDTHVESLLTSLTGAEAATVVNNNAAAVFLALNTLALGREVPVSRGELVEIGGSFRIPDIMYRSGCKLIEIGTTNRTHLKDYANAINDNTALLMKVHASNYSIEGFTQSIGEAEVANLAHENGLPLVTDLGSGTLIDLTQYGLPQEPTVARMIEAGADLVTFSGDKLLGGPQAGIIVGRKRYVDAINTNPVKRALRIDKITMAALRAVLCLYRDPDSLPERLPTLRFLTRTREEIEHSALQLLPGLSETLQGIASVSIEDTMSQIGSGSLPRDLLASAAIRIEPRSGGGTDTRLRKIADAFRRLEKPVIGRIHDGALLFDLRTLDDPSAITRQLEQLKTELDSIGR